MYSSSPPLLLTMGVHRILLILTIEEAACLQYRGQGGVGRLLHRKEERRHTVEMEYTLYFPFPPLLLTMEKVAYLLSFIMCRRMRSMLLT